MAMHRSVDELLAAESSSDEEESPVVQAPGVGSAAGASGAGQAGSQAASRPVPNAGALTVEEALACGDPSDDEDALVQSPPTSAGTVGAGPAAPPTAASKEASAAATAGGEVEEEEDDDEEDQLSDVSPREHVEAERPAAAVDLDELLAMGSESSSDEGGGGRAARPAPKSSKPQGVVVAAAPSEQELKTGAEDSDSGREAFARAPFAWCLEHERALLRVGGEDGAEATDKPSAGGGAGSEAPAPLLVEAKTRPCTELRRVLSQEYDRPTCVVTHSKYVGVGSLRGSLILLDPKAQDAPSEPTVLAPPNAGEEGCAVTAAAFSPDGGSALVGHKSGQLVLWDLATQRVAHVVKDVHTCAVLSVAFCRPSWQYALSADASGVVYFLTFTSTFGRRDCSRQLLLEQSANLGATLRILPLPPGPQGGPQQPAHPCDAQCLVALCATTATVLLTLHPSAQLLQKMQYQTKDTAAHSSWVPDAAWLRVSAHEWADAAKAQPSDPQLCVAFGQTIHVMSVSFEQEPSRMKEEFRISLLHKYCWASPIQGIMAFNESVLAVIDGASRLSVVQLPSSPEDPRPQSTEPQQLQLSAAHSEDVSGWSLAFHSYSSLDGARDTRSLHGSMAIFRGRSRTLYVCGMKDVWAIQIGRWGQRVEELVGRGEWSAALDVFLALHKGALPPLLDFPQAAASRRRAVDSRTTQVIQSYLASRLQQDTPRPQARQMCSTAVNACIEMGLWSVLYKTVFECFKAAGHMNVYCNTLEPFIVKGKIPRGQMDSEVLSSILQSYALPLEEEEQAALQHVRGSGGDGDEGAKSSSPWPAFIDMDHCIRLFPVARRLQQLVLYVDVSQLDLNLAIRLFTQHRLWTALVLVYCALGDYASPLELLAGECTQLVKKCSAKMEDGQPRMEVPLLECVLVRKLFFFLHRCFELRAFPLDPKDGPGLVHPGPGAIGELLKSAFQMGVGQQRAPPVFLRLLRLSPHGLFGALSSLYTSPSASHAVRKAPITLANGSPCILDVVKEPLTLNSLFRAIEVAMESCRRQAKEEDVPLPPGTEDELLWFIARALPRAGVDLPANRLMEVAEHLLATAPSASQVGEAAPCKALGGRSPEEAQQLLVGMLAAQEPLGRDHRDMLISKAMQRGFYVVASWLHEKHGEYDRALDCRLMDKSLREGIFEHIISRLAEHGDDPSHSKALVEAALQRLRQLVALDAEGCAVMICTQFANVADHDSVLERLRGYPQMELQYLEALLVRRRLCQWPSAEQQQAFFDAHVVRYVELLCSQAPGSVLPFVMENEQLPLRECLELCRKHAVTDASVHLLERTGDFVGVLDLFLSDYAKALEQLHRSFVECWDQNRVVVAKALKRLAASSSKDRCGSREGGAAEEAPWYEGFEDAQRCVELLEHANELSSRNSNIMTEAQLEDLWFGVLGRTVQLQEQAFVGKEASRRQAGLASALAALASQAMRGVLAYLSLPRSLKRICAEFKKSTLGVWKDPLESMLSGLNFQQGLLRAAKAVAAQDVVKPFSALKLRGSRGIRHSPTHLSTGAS